MKSFILKAARLIPLSLLLIASQSALANNVPVTEYETILISGSHSPIKQYRYSGAAQIINRAQIEASQALNLTDLLRGQAGMSISQSGGKGSITELRMRGAESNHVLILIDGIAVNDPGQGGLANLAHIDLENVERIEILKGAQSARWGSGAVAGVINIITRQADENVRLRGKFERGQADSNRAGVTFSDREENYQYLLSASHFSTDGHNIAPQGNEKDGYTHQQFNANGQWQITPQSQLNASVRLMNATNDFDDFGPSDADKHTDTRQVTGHLDWKFNSSASQWQHNIGLKFSRHNNQNYSQQIQDSSTETDTLLWSWISELSYTDSNAVSFGLELQQQDYTQTGIITFADPNQKQTNRIQSAIVDWVQLISPALTLTASGRFDNNSAFKNSGSQRIGLSYHTDAIDKLYSSFGLAVKNPTFTELYGFFPEAFIGNPDLDAESAKTWEVGAQKRFAQTWLFDLNIYRSQLEEEILTVFNPDFTSTSVNAFGTSTRKGLETSLQGTIQDTEIALRFGYVRARQPDANGTLQDEQRRAQRTASFNLLHPFSYDKAQLYLNVSYQSAQLDTDFSTFSPVTLGGYTLVDLAVSYQFNDNWKGTLRAENLLDKTYQDVFGFIPQGRRFYLGVHFRI